MAGAVCGVSAAIRGGAWANGIHAQRAGDAPETMPPIAAWVLHYVQPLAEWFQDLLGDSAQAAAAAASWEQTERSLIGAAAEFSLLAQKLDPLAGRTIRILRLRYADLQPMVGEAAQRAGALAAAAGLAAQIVAGTRQFIYDFLARLTRLSGELFGFTLQPFAKIARLRELADIAYEFVLAGRELLVNMLTAFRNLVALVQKLQPMIAVALRQLREKTAQLLPLAGALQGTGIAGIGGTLLGAAMGAAWRDALTASGAVTRYDERKKAQIIAGFPAPIKAKLQAKQLTGLADLVQANSLTDHLGKDKSTAIDIKLVREETGKQHWIVSLPSTQEWFDVRGTGAMNDFNTNLALLFIDDAALSSQYERAVLRAMAEAGIAPGDPVVYTGFSQGGIMAAKLAENTTLPYKTIGVVTNGSPIDTFKIPESIPVIAFQHVNDPVAMLDGNAFGHTPPNVERVVLPAPAAITNLAQTHNNDNYAASIATYASQISAQYSWMGGEIIDHQVFESVQR